MPLPEMIEIVPLSSPRTAEISVPGSKSITNRALILAALGRGQRTIEGALWSEDTQVMVSCLRLLGFSVGVEPDQSETSNRVITVVGRGGIIPRAGTAQSPLELFVGNAGTAARFLSALVCLGDGVYRLHGVERMHERPQGALFEALRKLGYRIEAPGNRLPAVIHGSGPQPGECAVSIEESSQFASALLLNSKIGGWKIDITGENAEESPYVAMTLQLIDEFAKSGEDFRIEPDASSGSYFWAAGWMASGAGASTQITVANWPRSGWQIDEAFPRFSTFPSRISRRFDLGDSIMTAIVLAPLAEHPVLFTDLGRLRLQECERVSALKTELLKCGANVREIGDSLEIQPSKLHGSEIETYGDHRMAMCFAILGLKIPSIKIKNPRCVRKTFPDFFQKLAANVPGGLGTSIIDASTNEALWRDQLFAD